MANLPDASTTIDESAGAIAAATGYIVVMSPVATSADSVPRVVSSTKGLLAQYGYSQGVDYSSLHFQKTRKPVIFVGMPIAVAGSLGSLDTTGVTGTSAVSVAADTLGVLEEVYASVTVANGGVVGTDQITFDLSLDGNITSTRVRLGTATSYTVPYVGIVISFGPGTLVAGDIATFRSKAPMWDGAGITAARVALAAQQKAARSWIVIGDMTSSTLAGSVRDQANAYETANERFIYARTQVSDRLPLAKKSKPVVKSAALASLTFAATGHTITRSAGSFITEGFAIGQIVSVAGSTSNNGSIGVITALTATIMTFASGVINEGPITTATLTGSQVLTFVAAGFTLTRSAGSWINDGFAVGKTVSILGSVSNNITSLPITALSATVMTFASGLVNEGPIASSAVSVNETNTIPAWISTANAAYASIDAQKRLDIAIGRGRVTSPITGSKHRRPAAWAASLREYTHDVQIPCWRKADGPLDGFDITDANGVTTEFDERTDGGALDARFTCLRSWANGPEGAFVALSLTRDSEGAVLSRTHNMAVANLAQTVIQAETENAIGQVLVLNDDGTGTDASLSLIEGRVNSALQRNLLQNFKEGQRASKAVWAASRSDNLSGAGARLNGVCALVLNGTLEHIDTSIQVQ